MNERPGQTGLLIKPEFPRSANYDPDWMMDNQMGLNGKVFRVFSTAAGLSPAPRGLPA